MATSKGMVTVSGVTYRIVERDDFHVVVRVLDDRAVGAFRYAPAFAIVESGLGAEPLLAVARTALRAGRLRWLPAREPWRLSSRIRGLLRGPGHALARVGVLVVSACRWLGGAQAHGVAAASASSFMTRAAILAALALVLSCGASRQSGPGDTAARRPPPVWTVDGRVLGVERSVPDSPASYVSLLVQPDREQPVRVELAPGWYLDRKGLRFSETDRVQVEGRRETRDGGTVVVARRIRSRAGVVELRDAEERPAWTR